MNEKLNERIAKALKLAKDALARYHAKRDEARADGTFSDEVGEMDLTEYGTQMAIAGELIELREEADKDAERKELFG